MSKSAIIKKYILLKVVAELVNCGELLNDDLSDPSDPTVIAENELLGAANSIESASVKLAQLKPRQIHVCFFNFYIFQLAVTTIFAFSF